MRPDTVSAIMTMAQADGTVVPEQLEALSEICRSRGHISRKLITAEKAQAILGEPEGKPISKPTLIRYAQEGKLRPIRLSCRKVRYDEREVRKLLNNGIKINS